MAKEHPHAAASDRVVPQKGLTFGVEVIVPGSFPALVTSFATEQIAEAWITDYKRRVAGECASWYYAMELENLISPSATVF